MNHAYWRICVVFFLGIAVIGRLYCDLRYPTQFSPERQKNIRDRLRLGFIYFLDLLFGGPIIAQLLGYHILPMQLPPLADTIMRSCGVVLGVFAAILSFLPRYARKQTWSFPMTSPNQIDQHQLLTSGPYRYVRHPFYAACIIGTLAMEMALASYLMFVLVPLLTLIVVLGVQREEQQLETAYGDQFREYKTRSWRLVPLVY